MNNQHIPCACMGCAFGVNYDRVIRTLELLAQGYDGPQIARKLHVSEGTTKRDKAAAFKWLGARTSAQAIALAIQNGVISIEKVSAA